MKKKLLYLLLSATMVLTLVGCGAKETGASGNQGTEVVADNAKEPTGESEPTVEDLDAKIKEEYKKDPLDKEAIIALLTEACDKGSIYAAYTLTYEYQQGNNFDKDETKASEYFSALKALYDAGNSGANGYMGMCYLRGFGTTVDNKLAVEYLEKATSAGDVQYYSVLGDLYSGKFEGVEANPEKMFECYYAYCNREDSGSVGRSYMHGLANCYLNGVGVEKDTDKALEWLNKASNAGHSDSSFLLGCWYFRGDEQMNIAQDYSKALEYFERVISDEKTVENYAQDGIYYLAGSSAGKSGDWTKAREYLNKSVELDKDTYAAAAQKNIDWMDANGK